jgi:hypothetical protein
VWGIQSVGHIEFRGDRVWGSGDIDCRGKEVIP